MNKTTRFSPGAQERAIRLVSEQEPEHGSQWAAIRSVIADDKLPEFAGENLPVLVQE